MPRCSDEYDADRPACVLGTLHKDNPAGLGRIVRDSGGVFEGIVEEKDATDAQRQLTEVNMSTYVFDAPKLVRALDELRNNNQQKEYYLTDCPGILKSWGEPVRALPVLQPCEALSINTFNDLAVVEAAMRGNGAVDAEPRTQDFQRPGQPTLGQGDLRVSQPPPGSHLPGKFPDGENFCKIEEDVRGRDVFLIQPTCPPVNDNLMELLIMIDSANGPARRGSRRSSRTLATPGRIARMKDACRSPPS